MKTVLITGASTGTGRASAEKFQSEGWNVIATMRQPEQETALSQLDNMMVLPLDVTDRESITAAVSAGVERFGALDVLLNNAGYGLFGPLEGVSVAQLERQYATNVFGPVYTMQACLPQFRRQGSGLIMNVSSIGGRLALPFNSLYHGTKFALEGISESLALELAPLGVQVKIIEPGGVKTDFGSRSLDMIRAKELAAYDQSLKGALSVFSQPERRENYSEASYTADIIYGAATDGSDQLRYLAGKDAESMAAERSKLSDEDYARWVGAEYKLNG